MDIRVPEPLLAREASSGMKSVRLWVLPLRKGSSEGLPAALTRRRDSTVVPIFGRM